MASEFEEMILSLRLALLDDVARMGNALMGQLADVDRPSSVPHAHDAPKLTSLVTYVDDVPP